MKKGRSIQTAGFLFIAVLILFISAFYAYPALRNKRETNSENPIAVRLWHVDTFEGGKGSRSAFLKRRAAEFSKTKDGAFVLVSDYTVEGALAAFEEGNYPDMLSFGVGLEIEAERCLPLARFFSGGAVGGACFAYPWCKGGYALYSLKEDFSELDEKKIVISQGGKNLACVAAALCGIDGDYREGVAAYVDFLNGKYDVLLGTQRDINRFAARGVNVYMQPIEIFSDLYQYLCVLKTNEKVEALCGVFFSYLLSESSQSKLSEIGMCGMNASFSKTENPFLKQLESVQSKYTYGVFSGKEQRERLISLSKGEGKTDGGEVLKKFLKSA